MSSIRFNAQGEALYSGITMAEYKALQALNRRKAQRWFMRNRKRFDTGLFFAEEEQYDSFGKAKQAEKRAAKAAALKARRQLELHLAKEAKKPVGRLKTAKVHMTGGLGKSPSNEVANYDKDGNLIFAGITAKQYAELETKQPKRAEAWLEKNADKFNYQLFMEELERIGHL